MLATLVCLRPVRHTIAVAYSVHVRQHPRLGRVEEPIASLNPTMQWRIVWCCYVGVWGAYGCEL